MNHRQSIIEVFNRRTKCDIRKPIHTATLIKSKIFYRFLFFIFCLNILLMSTAACNKCFHYI